MDMTNMKMSQETKSEYAQPSAVVDQPDYPYGLCLHLDKEALKKLGLSAASLKVGTDMTLEARVTVKGISISEMEGTDKNECVDLQITDLALSKASTAKTTEDKLYGTKPPPVEKPIATQSYF